MVQKGKLGSTILVNTDVYLDLILEKPCSQCGNYHNGNAKYKINVTGLSHVITVRCSICKYEENFGNESKEMDFSVCMAGAGLVGGLNREELRTTLAMLGITHQSSHTKYFENQELYFKHLICSAEVSAENALRAACEKLRDQGKYILEVGFDCSWSHVREASQASGEIIYNGELEGMIKKLI